MFWKFFKTWFMPQPSHDDLFPEVIEPSQHGTEAASTQDSVPAETPPQLESAAEMEKRAARESAPEKPKINEADFTDLVRPPEGSGERASRSGNPFSRTPAE